MSPKTYSRIVNWVGVVVVASVFSYTSLGRYQWIALAVAVAGCVVSAGAYFILHWGRQVNADEPCSANDASNQDRVVGGIIQPVEEVVDADTVLRAQELLRLAVLARWKLAIARRDFDVAISSAQSANKQYEELAAYYLKTMERRNWSALQLPVDVLQETTNVVRFRHPNGKDGRSSSKRAGHNHTLALSG